RGPRDRRRQQPIPHAGGEAAVADRRSDGAGHLARKAARQDESIPGTGRSASRCPSNAGGTGRLGRPLSTSLAGVLDRKSGLRERPRRGSDPMTKSISISAVIAAACLASACSKVEGVEAKPPRPVRTQAVAMAPPANGVRYSATIEAFQEVPLAFKASGYVDDLIQRQGADGRLRSAQAGDRGRRGT